MYLEVKNLELSILLQKSKKTWKASVVDAIANGVLKYTNSIPTSQQTELPGDTGVLSYNTTATADWQKQPR